MKQYQWKTLSLALVLALCAVLFTGCSMMASDSADEMTAGDPGYDNGKQADGSSGYYGAPTTDMDRAETTAEEQEISPEEPGQTGSLPDIEESMRKVIKTANITMEALDFDAAVQKLKDRVEELGGYFESSGISGSSSRTEGYSSSPRNGRFTVRLPADKLEDFMDGAGDIGNVTDSSTSEEDVSYQYYDMESRLKSLRTQYDRILALLEKAESLTDVVELERELSDITYQIENYTSSMRGIDAKVSYSTVNINIVEVYTYSSVQELPKTLGERISQRFEATITGLRRWGENFVVWLVGDSIVIIIWLVILAAAAYLILRLVKKSRRAKAERQMRMMEMVQNAQNAGPDGPKQD